MGWAQRAILAELAGRPSASVAELAAALYGQRWCYRGFRVRAAHYEAARRAVQGLVRGGAVRELPRRSAVDADGRTHIKRYGLSVGVT